MDERIGRLGSKECKKTQVEAAYVDTEHKKPYIDWKEMLGRGLCPKRE